MEYEIIERESRVELCFAIKDRLIEGWKPVGGVCVVLAKAEHYDVNRGNCPNKYLYAQAMVREGEIQ